MTYTAVVAQARYEEKIFAFKSEPKPYIVPVEPARRYVCASCGRQLQKPPAGEHGLGTWPKCCGDHRVERI